MEHTLTQLQLILIIQLLKQMKTTMSLTGSFEVVEPVMTGDVDLAFNINSLQERVHPGDELPVLLGVSNYQVNGYT